MLLPRFSLRTTLAVTTVAALFFLALARAAQGRPWAVCFSAAVGVVGFMLLVHACFYGLSYCLSALFGVERVVVRTSQGGLKQADATQSTQSES